MPERASEAKSIFYRVIKLDPEVRAAFLHDACDGDEELRREVQALLHFHDDTGSFLQSPLITYGASQRQASAAAPHGESAQNAVDMDIDLGFLHPCEKADRIGMLDHYEIIEVIGRGGMGIVLRALDTKLSRVVAIKVLAPELAANGAARTRFEREAQAAAAVSHEHVVTIFAVDEHNKLPYIVMECIVGKSLKQLTDEVGPLDVKSILRIGTQIASGLAAAHTQGLIHRDIKPANILLENGIARVKITDFGLARAIDDVGLTRTGQTTGTPQYMSPEQAEGKRVDHRSDLFSLGSVLYTLCTGRPAFCGDSSMVVLRRVCDETARPIREVNPDIPQWLVQIVDKLLAKNTRERFQSAAETADLLGRHLAHLQDPSRAEQPKPLAEIATQEATATTRRSQRAHWILMTSAAVLVATLVLAVLSGTGAINLKALVGFGRERAATKIETGPVAKSVTHANARTPVPAGNENSLAVPPSTADRPVKVFILAGDSNMGGRAAVSLLNYQANHPKTRAEFEHLMSDGNWLTRDDVWLKYGNRTGKLTVGYGQIDQDSRFGPELEFGHVVGDYFQQQVLIIKTEWGGATLFHDFRPPSSGTPTNGELKTQGGRYYQDMLKEISNTLDNLSAYFPDYQGHSYQIAGFVWFQGWNDKGNRRYSDAYTQNMANFIRDVRNDLKTPDLPFVIGQMGVGGTSADAIPKNLAFKQAQAAVPALAEFRGNVILVKTDEFWDVEADAVFQKGWSEHMEEWQKVGSDYPFHYLGSAKTFCRIGRAFGEAMVALLGSEKD